ncbi:MAG: ABC transporter permease [Candidatus Paceibacterota bacterium]
MKEILKKSLVLSFYELKVKNHNTYLGFLWYFLQPLLMFVVLFYVKHKVVDHEIVDFVPYLFIGVIMVHFFISSTNLMMKAITSNYELLNSRKIEPEIFILSKFFMSLWNHIFETCIVVLILSFLGFLHSFMYFLIVPFYAIFILGIGYFLCVVSTKVFDLTYIWSYLCQLLWFVLPIYYVANEMIFIIKYNPISYYLELARAFTFDLKNISYDIVLLCFVISLVFFVIGRLVFVSQREIISERIK